MIGRRRGLRTEAPVDDQLVETWLINDRINRYLLDAVPDAALGAAAFSHISRTLCMWAKSR